MHKEKNIKNRRNTIEHLRSLVHLAESGEIDGLLLASLTNNNWVISSSGVLLSDYSLQLEAIARIEKTMFWPP